MQSIYCNKVGKRQNSKTRLSRGGGEWRDILGHATAAEWTNPVTLWSRELILSVHTCIYVTRLVFFLSEIRVIRFSCARSTKVVVLDAFVTDIRKGSFDRESSPRQFSIDLNDLESLNEPETRRLEQHHHVGNEIFVNRGGWGNEELQIYSISSPLFFVVRSNNTGKLHRNTMMYTFGILTGENSLQKVFK